MNSYKHSESTLNSSKDNFSVFYQSWIPDEVRRIVVFQHGFGEHSGRYGNLIEAFSGTGTAFFGLDARGHGRTEGKRGHVAQFQLFVDDLADLIALAQDAHPQQPLLLLGHSMGGIIALQYALEGSNQRNLQGLIVSSAGLELHMNLGQQIKKALAFTMARIMPAATVDADLDVNFLSHDPAVVQAYRDDPLVHGKISFQMGKNLLSLGKVIFQKASHLNIPCYIFHGTGDQIVNYKGSERLYEYLTTADKTLRIYPDFYHECMNEAADDKQTVLRELREWALAHC
ncbi:MAG: lysophospholipase [Leptospiraceae bacterium]|nr:lysophospholipase [Leptospiraceae bacterium]